MRCYLLLLFLLPFSFLKAQNYFSFPTPAANMVYSGTQPNLTFVYTLYDTSVGNKAYTWERTDECPLPPGWSAAVCDCDNCYPESMYLKGGTGFLADSCVNTLTYFFAPGAAMGSHTTKMRFWDPQNPVAQATIYLTVNGGCPTGLETPSQQQVIMVFPNPTADLLTLRLAQAGEATNWVLLDATGRVALRGAIPAGQVFTQIDLSALPSGNYRLRLNDHQGRIRGHYPIRKL